MTRDGLLFADSEPAGEFDSAEDWNGPAGGGDVTANGALYLAIDGWEGPLDLLLDLARKQRVDLRQISILALVDQYLTYIEQAEQLRLELAADYLVMAAWLAYLKSSLLLPKEEQDRSKPRRAGAQTSAEVATAGRHARGRSPADGTGPDR